MTERLLPGSSPASRNTTLWLAVAAFTLSLAGCGQEEADAPSSAAVSTAGKSAAQIAAEAAQPLCVDGQTITIVWEAGLQSLDPLNLT